MNLSQQTTRISLEFQPTFTDFLQLASDRRSRWSLIARRVIAAGVLAFALIHLRTHGLDWEVGVSAVVAIMFGIPIYITYLFLWLIGRTGVRISIDDDSICFGFGKHYQTIPWSSFATLGSATEFENHFWLECGRGTVWIPKRAFPTMSELRAFRQFVVNQIGDQCKFNTGPTEDELNGQD